jgi:gag-polypeptide of LTR copia-type
MADHLKLGLNLSRLAEDGSNGVTYRDRLLWAMNIRAQGDHLTSTSPNQHYINAETTGSSTPETRRALDGAVEKQLIATSIPDAAFNRVKAHANAKDVWEELMDLQGQLASTMCGEDENVRSHFERLAMMRERLASLGKTITDTEYAYILIRSLPPSYEPVWHGLNAAAELTGKTIYPKNVIHLAGGEFDRRALKKTAQGSDEAFVAESPRKGKDKRRDMECYNCHKLGHTKAECWAKGGGKEGQGHRRNSGAPARRSTGAAAEERRTLKPGWR